MKDLPGMKDKDGRDVERGYTDFFDETKVDEFLVGTERAGQLR
jgi:hypothetical protein